MVSFPNAHVNPRDRHLQIAPRCHVAARSIVQADGVKVLHPVLYDGLNQFSQIKQDRWIVVLNEVVQQRRHQECDVAPPAMKLPSTRSFAVGSTDELRMKGD